MEHSLHLLRQAWSRQLWHALTQGAGAYPAAVSALDVDSGWILDEWERELLRRLLLQARGGSVRFVESSRGGGRSHFLHLFRERAGQVGMATVLLPEERQAETWASPLALYRLLAQDLQPARAASERGLVPLILSAPREATQSALFPELPPWGRALELWARHREPAARQYLLGEAVVEGDKLGLHAGLSERDAGLALRCLLQYLEFRGEAGLVVLGDGDGELEPSRERATLESLRNLIDRCAGGDLPGLLLVYAVLPRFRQQVVPEYEALQQRLHNGFSHGPAGCLRPILILEEQRAWRAEQGLDFPRALYESLLRVATLVHPQLAEAPLTLRRNAELLLDELPWSESTPGAARGLTRTIARWFESLAGDSGESDSHAARLARFLEAEAP